MGAGKVGNDSAAAKFAAATSSNNVSIDEHKPYSEVGLHRYPQDAINRH